MAITDLFRRREDARLIEAEEHPATVPTKALPTVLAVLKARERSVLLDLGPVVGANVTYFGEQLGCKIFVEDLFSDIDRHTREGSIDRLPAFFESRFARLDGGVDGILCWDVFDYLDKPAAQALAAQLTRLLRPSGVILAFFATTISQSPSPRYAKQTVVNDTTLRREEYAAAQPKQAPLLNRDIIRMFEPARVLEQFLLKTHLREMCFRMPAA